MFLVIPLILIAGSAFGISYIVWPKVKELKAKDDLPAVEASFWRLMSPEFFSFLKKAEIRYKVFKKNMIVDYEKFLRRAKIASLKTDNIINKLFEKRPRVPTRPQFKDLKKPAERENNLQFKNREGNLIADIAKNPKDKNLYKILGALYMENQMFGDAREVFDVILELDPNDEEAKEWLEKSPN